ncbi:tRNA (adenosine(37)-N6)-dimethylallyltransferase MiaA [Marihabitans asiaticum]|uniref:tRNA dimethylallyltransferase n=1 Tax=Marihabitans asiaticum TaxID=415218 RepID=A0A560WA71_9MICO|nr:tRNA (adenosine(37)-N6)-dimethylallyltransferase MiaA [Marihabitans asiaticum]TWD14526.1 tRNA dimethylallyltransferase [Marihabitans asiaticum]
MVAPAQVVAVVGATATGKSGLALDLAERLGGEVVNADSMQLYRGMDIGTAKLTPQERRGIAHHLLDVLDVTEESTVADYQLRAREAIEQVRARGRLPILAGGSGLYVRAALDELEIPPTDPDVRARLEERSADGQDDLLRTELRAADPAAADAIEPNNVRRVIRALEVIELTGRPFSATAPTKRYVLPSVVIGLYDDWDALTARLEQRVRRMWADGMLDEVADLDRAGLREGRTASRAIGYAQALRQLDGVIGEAEAITSTQAATRRYARRQESWLRPDPRVRWLCVTEPDLVGRALCEVEAGDVSP